MKLSKLFFAALIVFTSTTSFAQDTETDSHEITIGISEVALLDLEAADKNITLNSTAPTEAGLATNFDVTDSSIWLNYSSIVGSGNSRNIKVKISNGTVPSGLQLTVEAGNDAGNGAGTKGSPVSAAVVLNATDADIITGVGSAYTGNGVNNGHNLTYKLSQSGDYSTLDYDNNGTVLTITYTLTDDI